MPVSSRPHTAIRPFALFLLLAIGLGACAPLPATSPKPTAITLQEPWLHQATAAGFYAADQQGYYAEEGLTVTFREGGPNADLFAPVLDGTAQFTVAGADQLILARAEGKPVRAIGSIFRRSPVVFITKADSGITRPEQFVGQTIRIAPTLAPSLHTMMAHLGITRDQYDEITLPSDISAFAAGKAAVWGVYSNGFAITLEQAGYKLNYIYPDDYGVHFYSEVVIAPDSLIAADPQLVLRFLRASLKGWTYAVENPEVAGSLVQQLKPDADITIENAKMLASLPLINTGEDNIGWMRPLAWESMAQALRADGVLTGTLDVQQAYTLEFLEQIYQIKASKASLCYSAFA